MATKEQKAFCVLQFAKTESVVTVQHAFRIKFGCDPPDKESVVTHESKQTEDSSQLDTVNELVNKIKVLAKCYSSESGLDYRTSSFEASDRHPRIFHPDKSNSCIDYTGFENVFNKSVHTAFSSAKIPNLEDIAPIHLALPDFKVPANLPQLFNSARVSDTVAEVSDVCEDSENTAASIFSSNDQLPEVRNIKHLSNNFGAVERLALPIAVASKQHILHGSTKNKDQEHPIVRGDLAPPMAYQVVQEKFQEPDIKILESLSKKTISTSELAKLSQKGYELENEAQVGAPNKMNVSEDSRGISNKHLADYKGAFVDNEGFKLNRDYDKKFSDDYTNDKNINTVGERKVEHSDEPSIKEYDNTALDKNVHEEIIANNDTVSIKCFATHRGSSSTSYLPYSPKKLDDQRVYFTSTKITTEATAVGNASLILSNSKRADSRNNSVSSIPSYEGTSTIYDNIAVKNITIHGEIVTQSNHLQENHTHIVELDDIQKSQHLPKNSSHVISEIGGHKSFNLMKSINFEETEYHNSKQNATAINVISSKENANSYGNKDNDEVQQTTEDLHKQGIRKVKHVAKINHSKFGRRAQLKNENGKSGDMLETFYIPCNQIITKVRYKDTTKKGKIRSTYWDKFVENVHNDSHKPIYPKHPGTSKLEKITNKQFEVVSSVKSKKPIKRIRVSESKLSSNHEEVKEMLEDTNFFSNFVLEPLKRQSKMACENPVVGSHTTNNLESAMESVKKHKITEGDNIVSDENKTYESNQSRVNAGSKVPKLIDVTLERQPSKPATNVHIQNAYTEKENVQLDDYVNASKADEIDDSAKASLTSLGGKQITDTQVKSDGKRTSISAKSSGMLELSNLSDLPQTNSSKSMKPVKSGSMNSSLEVKLNSATCSSTSILNSAMPRRRTSSRLEHSTDDSASTMTGAIRYRLSDPAFLEKGWSIIPSENIMVKVRTFRSQPAKPSSVWCAQFRCKSYSSGAVLCAVDECGSAKWFYPDGGLAASLGKSPARGILAVFAREQRKARAAIIARFDSFGNGCVYGPSGDIRLRFTQRGGVFWDTCSHVPMRWAWSKMKGIKDTLEEVVCEHSSPDDPHLANPRHLCCSKAYKAAIAKGKEQHMMALKATNANKRRSNATGARSCRTNLPGRRQSRKCLVDSVTEDKPSDYETNAHVSIAGSPKNTWGVVYKANEADIKNCSEQTAPPSSYTPIKPILMKLNEYFTLRLTDQENISLDFLADKYGRRFELGVSVDPSSVDHEDLLEPGVLSKYTNEFISADSVIDLVA